MTSEPTLAELAERITADRLSADRNATAIHDLANVLAKCLLGEYDGFHEPASITDGLLAIAKSLDGLTMAVQIAAQLLSMPRAAAISSAFPYNRG